MKRRKHGMQPLHKYLLRWLLLSSCCMQRIIYFSCQKSIKTTNMRKLPLFLSIFSVLVFLSCRRQNDVNTYRASYVTIVKSTFERDTILGNLTIEAGHRELPEIITPPKHAITSQV